MAFQDLREFFDGSLRLPVGGKTYVIPPIPFKDGLMAQTILDAAIKAQTGRELTESDFDGVLDDDDERSLYQQMLGPAYDEMVTDGLNWPELQRCGTTAFLFFTSGEQAATSFWEEGPGEAPAPNRATRRSKAAAASSRPRASTDGSTTRASKSKKAASAGRSSSSTGPS